MLGPDENYVRSPFLNPESINYNPRNLGEELEQELESMVSGNYKPEHTDTNLRHYSFEDSTQNANPSWWRPRIALELEVNDTTVESWLKEVENGLQESENYSLTRHNHETDPLTGETPQTKIVIGDYEQKNENVRIQTPEDEQILNSIEAAKDYLNENTVKREVQENMPSYNTERNGFKVNVDSDLSTGFFQAKVQVGPDEHSSEIWMPYADNEKALLIGTPSQFSPETESNVVPVQGESYTGDPLTDAVAEGLSYFLPFEGIQQPKVTSEAIDYRNENPLDREPYTQQINPDSWEKLGELDQEYQKRIKNKLDQISLNPEKTPLEKRDTGNVDQIGSEDIYIKWNKHDESQTVKLLDIMERKDAFELRGDKNART